jgi:Chagasin family peptidase inhibitor I42
MALESDSVALRPGAEHTVRLPGMGAVGYDWLVTVEGDEDAVEVVKTTAAHAERLLPGTSADRIVTVRAVRPGKAVVRLEQRRPPLPEEPPLDTYVLDVTVGE